MSQSVFGAAAAVTMLNRALNNSSPAAAVFSNQVATAGDTEASQFAFARQFAASFNSLTDAQFAERVMGNMGMLPNDALRDAFTAYLGANAKADRGVIVLQLGQILATMENATGEQAIYASQAVAWNKEVEQSYIYSSNTSNTTPFDGDFSGTDTFTLTRFTDVKTSANFNGYLDYNQYTGADEQTLTTGDRLTGTAADTDTLFAQQTAGSRPTLNGIEIISIDAKAAAPNLDMSDTHGAKKVVNKGSNETAALTFSNINNMVDVAIEATNSNTTVTFAPSVVAGASDNLNLSVNGAGIAADRADFTAAGIETLAISATGAASMLGTVATGAGGIRAVTITGDQNLSVGTKTAGGFNSAALSTVNAADATGNLFLNVVAAGATSQTVTTGTGNDTVVVAGLSALDTYTLGDGTDRLVVTDAGTNQAMKLVGVEQVEARVAGTNLNLTNAAGVNLIAVAEGASIANVTAVKSGTTFAFEGVGAANAVPAAAPAFGVTNFNLAGATGSTDVINVTFSNAGVQVGAGGAIAINTITNTGNNVETLNFNFSDVGADDTVTIAGIVVGTAARALNFTSDSKVTVTTPMAMTGLTSVDATGVKDAFTANIGIVGDAANVSVRTGGSGNNNVTVAKGNADAGPAVNTTLTVDGSAGSGSQTFTINNTDADVDGALTPSLVFNGGTGADTLVLTSAGGSINRISGGAGIDNITLTASAGVDHLVLNLGDTGSTVATGDTVNGFKAAGADRIDLRGFGFDAALQGVTAAVGALNGTAAEFGGQAVAAFSAGGNTTLYVDTNGDNKLGAGDLVVNLIGTAAVVGADILWA